MGRKIFFSICILILPLIIAGCNLKQPLPFVSEKMACYRFPTGQGPEDMVLDTFSGSPRLLISSYERRKPADQGDIYTLDIRTGESRVIPRTSEPLDLAAFKPQGMDIRHNDGITSLYVILHDPYARHNRLENAVGVYAVYRNELRMTAFLKDSKCLWSPNDLSVLPSGGIYLTNDYRSSLDLYLRRKVSELAYYDPATGHWRIVASGLGFVNGIYARPKTVYVTTTQGNQLLSFPRSPDGSLGTPQPIVKLKGGDNIMPYGKYFLVCAHFDDLAFMRHKSDPQKPAPSVVFRIDPAIGDKKAIFADNGTAISTASTALIVGNKLYISQVFDPFILVCNVPADIDW